MSLYIALESNAIPQLLSQGVSPGDIRYALIRVAQKFTPILQRSAPVDTGRLRASLRVELLPDDMGVALTSQVFYAGFVEYGTKKMTARQYATALIPDIYAYMNALLAELGNFNRTSINSFVTDQNSFIGQTVQRVSQSILERVLGNKVQPVRVKPLNVSDQAVEQLLIEAESVE